MQCYEIRCTPSIASCYSVPLLDKLGVRKVEKSGIMLSVLMGGYKSVNLTAPIAVLTMNIASSELSSLIFPDVNLSSANEVPGFQWRNFDFESLGLFTFIMLSFHSTSSKVVHAGERVYARRQLSAEFVRCTYVTRSKTQEDR